MSKDKVTRGTYRVNYFLNGQPVTALVVATDENAASIFMGVRDGSAQVNRVAYPVEVDGLDTAHDALPSMPVNTAPPQPPKQLSDAELAKLRTILAKA